MLYVIGLDGEPLRCPDAIEWARWFETADRSIGHTEVGPGRVSTVFLGIDHGWFGGPPVLWETMTFGVPGLDGQQERYTSRAAAVEGHARHVAMAQLALQVAQAHL